VAERKGREKKPRGGSTADKKPSLFLSLENLSETKYHFRLYSLRCNVSYENDDAFAVGINKNTNTAKFKCTYSVAINLQLVDI
jgi:hypothetical protein